MECERTKGDKNGSQNHNRIAPLGTCADGARPQCRRQGHTRPTARSGRQTGRRYEAGQGLHPGRAVQHGGHGRSQRGQESLQRDLPERRPRGPQGTHACLPGGAIQDPSARRPRVGQSEGRERGHGCRLHGRLRPGRGLRQGETGEDRDGRAGGCARHAPDHRRSAYGCSQGLY